MTAVEGAEFVQPDTRCPRSSPWFGRCLRDAHTDDRCLYQQSAAALSALEAARVAAQKENQKP